MQIQNFAWSRVPGQDNAWEPLDFSVNDVVFDTRAPAEEVREIDWRINDVIFNAPRRHQPIERRNNRNPKRYGFANRNQGQGAARNQRRDAVEELENEADPYRLPALDDELSAPYMNHNRNSFSWLQGRGSPQHSPPLDGTPQLAIQRPDPLALALANQVLDFGKLGSTLLEFEFQRSFSFSGEPSSGYAPGSWNSPVSTWSESGINFYRHYSDPDEGSEEVAALEAQYREDEELNAIVRGVIE